MFIVQAGGAVRKIIPDVVGKKFYHCFELRRPRLQPTFDDIRQAKNAAFLLTCHNGQISLKGQMLLDEKRALLLFVGAPIVESAAVLRRYQLTLSDFQMTDSSIDLLMFQQQKLINQKLEHLAFERAKELELERNKTERLLRAILPAHIVRDLKDRQEVIAEQFEQVTVMFLDLVGFTRLTTELSAIGIVNLLNDIFRRFDELLESTDVEKIKTIGDAYMCVGGLRGLSPRQSAERVALVALQMRSIIEAVETVGRLQARIGVHSGPVVAGVIGASKFSYDLWGDTVNTAARMESHGEPGKIQCTSSVYRLLRETFDFEERGEIEVKGKGAMRTYFLVGEKNGSGGED
jgi:class 3 adenylate cyclase